MANKKPENKTRILIFGDSHTFSMGADDNSSYPARVEQKLNAKTDRYETLNFGVLGHDLRQILLHINENAFRYDPDVIIITFHSGDILESPEQKADAEAQSKADVSLSLEMKTMNDIQLKELDFDEAIKSGKIKLNGDRAIFDDFLGMLDNFKFWFNIVTP